MSVFLLQLRFGKTFEDHPAFNVYSVDAGSSRLLMTNIFQEKTTTVTTFFLKKITKHLNSNVTLLTNLGSLLIVTIVFQQWNFRVI